MRLSYFSGTPTENVIDTRRIFAANIAGAAWNLLVWLEYKHRQLHQIPHTSAPEEVINYHIGNIDSFINPALMEIEGKEILSRTSLTRAAYLPCM